MPAALATLISIYFFVANLSILEPTIQGDEGGYLSKAAVLAGYVNQLTSSYFAGYPLLLTPAFWFGSTPYDTWVFVKLINAMLWFLGFLSLYASLKILFPDKTTREIAAISFTAFLYPFWVTIFGFAFSENASVPVFMIFFFLFVRATTYGGINWLLCSLPLGFLWWIHPKAAPAIAASLIAGVFAATRRREWRFPTAGGVILMAVMATYTFWISPEIHQTMSSREYTQNLHYPSVTKLLSPIIAPQGIQDLFVRFSGHFFYLIIASSGIIVIGLLYAVQALTGLRGNNSREPVLVTKQSVSILIILSVLGTIGLSVLLHSIDSEGDRLDAWLYGRYVESVILPPLAIGLALLNRRAIGAAIAVSLILAFVLSIGLPQYGHTAPFNISGFWQEFFIRDRDPLFWWGGSLGILLLLYASVPSRYALVVIATFFVVCAYLQLDWHRKANREVASRMTLVKNIRDNWPRGTCVGFNREGVSGYRKSTYYYHYAFYLYDYEYRNMSAGSWHENCDGPLISHQADLDSRLEGVTLAATERDVGPFLWVNNWRARDVLPLNRLTGVDQATLGLQTLLVSGWHDVEPDHVWSGAEASLRAPILDECSDLPCELRIEFVPFAASDKRPVGLTIGAGGRSKTYTFTDQGLKVVSVPLPSFQSNGEGDGGVATRGRWIDVTLSVDNAISPRKLGLSSDRRTLGVALKKIGIFSAATGRP